MTRTGLYRRALRRVGGAIWVHARPLDEDEVGSAEEIDTRSEEDGLNEKAERETGENEEVPSELECNGDDQHVPREGDVVVETVEPE